MLAEAETLAAMEPPTEIDERTDPSAMIVNKIVARVVIMYREATSQAIPLL
jgi:hypothetical protein